MKSLFTKLLITSCLSLFCAPSFAQLSNEDKWALEQVQKMLVTPSDRATAIANSPGAGAAHSNALNTVGSENIEELYAISAIVMADLTKSANGDPIKMQAILDKAKADPKAFFQSLSPASISAIKKLAPKVKGKSS